MPCVGNSCIFAGSMEQQLSIYFAPFQGITTKVFREVYTTHFGGIDKFFTPYFSNIAIGHPLPALKMKALAATHENGVEIVPQILSKDAAEIISFANSCHELGFNELNWNLGCPYPQVARKKRGSGMLPHPEMVDEILAEVMKSMSVRFSVKCRLGYFSAEEMQALIPVFNRYPISELTIHARIGKQLYSGKPDYDSFAAALEQLQMPVVYNGDIFSVEDYETFSTKVSAINQLMIGRGLLTNPFLAMQIKGIAIPGERLSALKDFMENLYLAYRQDKGDNLSILNNMKELWVYMMNAFTEPVAVFRKIKKAKTFQDYEAGINDIFETMQLKTN